MLTKVATAKPTMVKGALQQHSLMSVGLYSTFTERNAVRPRLLGLGFASTIALMLVSLLYTQHVIELGLYEATYYGLPLPLYLHFVDVLTPTQMWLPELGGIVVDWLFWLAASFVTISIAFA